VIGARAWFDGSFASAEGVDTEDKVAQSGQGDAPGLDVRVHARPGPVAVDRQHCGASIPDGLGTVKIGRDPNSRPALEGQAFDGIAIAPDDSQNFRIERAGG
jgi:hypothetical protein